MTTTSDFEPGLFYDSLKEVILEVIQRKISLFSILKEQPDVIQRRDALNALLTMFSMADSVMMARGFQDGKLQTNIEAIIKDFYDQTGNAEVIGMQPSDLVWEMLEDLAYSVKPRFKMSDFENFIMDQPLRREDKEMLEDFEDSRSGTESLMLVIAAILIVMKAEMILADVVILNQGKKKTGD